MKVHTIFIVVCLSALIIGCSNKSRFSNQTLGYEELPNDVKEKFENVYNYCHLPTINGTDTIKYMPPFIEAYNLNGDTVVVNMNKNIFNNSFTINSSGKQIELSLNILERVFIIKDDTIYYPISGSGITTYGESRSCNVDVDTLMFQVSIMK